MSKKALIRISTYSGTIGLILIVFSYMIIGFEFTWVNDISLISLVLGCFLFAIFIFIIIYAYIRYKDDRINDGKSL